MAIFTFEVPDESAARIAAAVCARHGFEPESPQQATAFVAERVFADLRQQTLDHEADLAASAAREATYTNPDDPLAAALFTPVVPPAPEPPVGPQGPDGPVGPVGPTGITGSTSFAAAIRR